MRLFRCFLLMALGLVLAPFALRAQDADIPLNDATYHFIDRMDIKGVTGEIIPTDIRPYPREQAAQWLAKVDTLQLGKSDRRLLDLIRTQVDDDYVPELQRKGLWKVVYRNRRDFLHYRTKKDSLFRVYLNPILYLSGGAELPSDDALDNQITYRNGRGAVLRGSLFGKVGFYTHFIENQARYPYFVQNRTARLGALQGAENVKPFGTNGYDFGLVKGYLTYSPIKYLRFKLGRDNAHFGFGDRSLFLSGYGADYWLFSANLKIWKLEYHYQLTQMIDFIPNKPDQVGTFPRKYGVFHMLSFRPDRRFSISFFESVVYASSMPNGRRGFELQYLNPVIFYRTIEQAIGSPDNALLGLQAKANIIRHFQLYGQFLLDDLNIAETQNASGWWGNKFGYQLGVKWIDIFGIQTLDAQVEYNRVRPYVYAHFNNSSNYLHYNQFLGHDYGSNVSDIALTGRYRPHHRVFLDARFNLIQQGIEPAGSTGLNVGWDPTVSDVTFNNGLADPRYGNQTLQGEVRTVKHLQAGIRYRILRLNAWVEGELFWRDDSGTSSIGGGITVRYSVPGQGFR